MFKKIQLALLTFCISASSYAYVVQTQLTVENKTNEAMVMTIEQPNGQTPVNKPIPAHQTSILDLDNGDHSGLLYQTSTAPFKIKSVDANAKVYAQGRVAYYVGASLWNKYSFLDGISAADNIKIESQYSCKNGGNNTTFDNKIVIDGTPQNEMLARPFPSKVSCQGLKSSALDEKSRLYTATCSDGKSSNFWKGTNVICLQNSCIVFDTYGNYEEAYTIEMSDSPLELKNTLDIAVGNKHCATW